MDIWASKIIMVIQSSNCKHRSTCIIPALLTFKKNWTGKSTRGNIVRVLILEVMMVERSEEYWSIYFEGLFFDVSDIKVYVTP